MEALDGLDLSVAPASLPGTYLNAWTHGTSGPNSEQPRDGD